MKSDLLATLADKNYIKQAKQLFSSVYHNAGWKGDYMLLSHQIPEKGLSWFKDKGILIKRCQPLPCLKDWQNKEYPSCVFDKFYLFQKEFKKWDKIVFLDADIIVRTSLEKLTEIKEFGAVPDLYLSNLSQQLIKKRNKKKLIQIKRKYNLKGISFNAGVITFSTEIIKKNTFSKLNSLFKKYSEICGWAEQTILNLFFQERWEKLPLVFNNTLPDYTKTKSIILHFTGKNRTKPWNEKSSYYKKWNKNLKRANLINLKNRPSPKRWSPKKIKRNSFWLKKEQKNWLRKQKLNCFLSYLDKNIGKIGKLLKENFPRIYSKIKGNKTNEQK